jgi:uncharacterized membrane protein
MNPTLPLHPLVVHTPIALIILSALFELAGRAFDGAWWRKAAFAMLIVGVLGASVAVLTGNGAGEAAEKQGVPGQAVDSHEEMGLLTLWIGIGAVLARALAARPGPLRGGMGALALALHLTCAVTVGIAGYRGGKLVFDHGAGVKVRGHLVPSDEPPKPDEHAVSD